jgi:hypothetical protein
MHGTNNMQFTGVGEFALPTHPRFGVAASKLDIYQMLCVQFELLMMGGKIA